MLGLMIDIESLALEDNALITQIGFVVFDEDYNPVGDLCVNLDITAGLLDGFDVNPDTLKFWRGQNKDVVNSVMYAQPRLTPRVAAQLIDKWIKDTFKGENFIIWANGLLFDIPKIDGLMRRYGLKPVTDHTRYNKIQDFRTVRQTAKDLHPIHFDHMQTIITNDSLHNALADCYWQLETLAGVMQILGGKYSLREPSEGEVDPYPELTQTRPAMLHNADEVTMVPVLDEEFSPVDEPTWEDEEPDPVAGEFFEHVFGNPVGEIP